jgi:hypothetical protein
MVIPHWPDGWVARDPLAASVTAASVRCPVTPRSPAGHNVDGGAYHPLIRSRHPNYGVVNTQEKERSATMADVDLPQRLPTDVQ